MQSATNRNLDRSDLTKELLGTRKQISWDESELGSNSSPNIYEPNISK